MNGQTDDPGNRPHKGEKVGPNPFVRPDDPGTKLPYYHIEPGMIQKPLPSWYLVAGLIAGFVLACLVGWLLG